jgi:hypothetical protein
MSATVEVIGVKETLRDLRTLEPELRKQFNKDAKKVAEPIVSDAKRRYPAQLLSGMARNWSVRGRQIFPYSQTAAARGVSVKVDTGRRSTNVITVIQKNPAAAIIDMAGKGNGSERKQPQGDRFVSALTLNFGQPSRVMWPAAESRLDQVQAAMVEWAMAAAEEVNKKLTVI